MLSVVPTICLCLFHSVFLFLAADTEELPHLPRQLFAVTMAAAGTLPWHQSPVELQVADALPERQLQPWGLSCANTARKDGWKSDYGRTGGFGIILSLSSLRTKPVFVAVKLCVQTNKSSLLCSFSGFSIILRVSVVMQMNAKPQQETRGNSLSPRRIKSTPIQSRGILSVVF